MRNNEKYVGKKYPSINSRTEKLSTFRRFSSLIIQTLNLKATESSTLDQSTAYEKCVSKRPLTLI